MGYYSSEVSGSRILDLFSTIFLIILSQFVIYGEFIERVTSLNILSRLDDVILFLAITLVFYISCLRLRASVIFSDLCVLVALLSIISFYSIYTKDLFAGILSAWLFCKIFIMFIVLENIPRKILAVAIDVIAFVHIVGISINLLFPSFLFRFLPDTPYLLDLLRIYGLELNPNRFGFISVSLFFYYIIVRKYKFISFLMFFCMAVSLSKSSIAVFIMVVSYFIYTKSSKNKLFSAIISLLALSLLSIVFWYVLGDRVSMVIDSSFSTVDSQSKYIRAAMLYYGVGLAVAYFPIGSGGGTFGSALSLGSPVFENVGIANWPSVADGSGIHDSGIGTMLGEYGFLGAFIMSIALYRLFMFSLQNRRDSIFMVAVVIFYSLFRTAISSYFYSFSFYVLVLSMGRTWGRSTEVCLNEYSVDT